MPKQPSATFLDTPRCKLFKTLFLHATSCCCSLVATALLQYPPKSMASSSSDSSPPPPSPKGPPILTGPPPPLPTCGAKCLCGENKNCWFLSEWINSLQKTVVPQKFVDQKGKPAWLSNCIRNRVPKAVILNLALRPEFPPPLLWLLPGSALPAKKQKCPRQNSGPLMVRIPATAATTILVVMSYAE